MEPIADIDLSQEAKLVELDFLQEKRNKVGSCIRGILNDLRKWNEEIDDLGKQAKKLEDKRDSAKLKYQKLLEGDWSVLNENMFKASPTSETTTKNS